MTPPSFSLSRSRLCALFTAVSIISAAGDTPTSLVEKNRPLAPGEALASLRVPAGLRVELVAAEPLIMDPVAFDWGPDGRLWVVEMRDYPNGLTWNAPDDPLDAPGGRVKVLTDTDGDGRYDEAAIFLDDLSYPTGVKVWGDGILVTAAPEIFYAEDTDGDDRADLREVWYRGFARSNQQHRVNGLAWGLDNWLHVANGDGGGLILSHDSRDAVDIRGLDLKIDPFTRELQPLLGRTQCGRYRDDWGNWFGCNNSNPLWHYPLPWDKLRRNPEVASPRAYVDVPREPGASPVYPISDTVARFNQPDRANRFTSACGPAIYRDALLGEEFSGNALICEPVHNLVSRQVLEPRGATFTSDRHPDERQSEFFASTDSWSRPVSVRTGPDGALWIADMYRLVIEHPEWIPREWQEKLDLRAGSDLGRIYRVVRDTDTATPVPRLDSLDDNALVARLTSPNGTVRDLVHQMLLWRRAVDVAPNLRALAQSADLPTARLHALCVLDGLGALDSDTVHAALTDPHPGVVRHAVRLSPGFVEAGELSEFVLPQLGDAHVALELAGVLGEMDGDAPARLLAALLLRHRDDPHVTAVALSSVREGNLGAIIDHLALAYTDHAEFQRRLGRFDPDLRAPSDALVRDLARMAVKWDLTPAAARLVSTLAAGHAPGTPASWRVAILVGLLEHAPSLEAVTPDQPEAREALRQLVANARAAVTNPDLPTGTRAQIIRLLGCAAVFDHATDLPTILSLIDPRTPPALRESAFETLGRVRHPDTASGLLGHWTSLVPTDRARALGLLLARADWIAPLLTALEDGVVPRSQIDAASRDRLLKSTDPVIAARAAALFSSASNATREQVLNAYAKSLARPGDPAVGKTIFSTACIACHVAEGVGNAVGPDLAALTDRSADSLLVAILDPNRAVEDKFVNYLVTSADGNTVSGLIADESANTVNLRLADGSPRAIARADIAEMTSTGASLMPEGLENLVGPEQMPDLIAYVASLGTAPEPAPDLAARVSPGKGGVIELRASKCRISGDRLEFMADFDALGWWTSEKDRAQWTVVLDRPGTYQVEWEYSVAPDAAGNAWQLTVNGVKALGGKVESTGGWETFATRQLGRLDLPAADNQIILRSEGPVKKALLDLRAIRLVPVGE